MKNGLIFFEDGTVVPFGQLHSVNRIVAAAQELLPELLRKEREQLLRTVSKDELKQIVENVTIEERNDDSSDI